MPDYANRLSGQAPGRFYIDDTCIDCGLCREMLPAVFQREEELGMTLVIRQPATPSETAEAEEAARCCPSESIGSDGPEA